MKLNALKVIYKIKCLQNVKKKNKSIFLHEFASVFIFFVLIPPLIYFTN